MFFEGKAFAQCTRTECSGRQLSVDERNLVVRGGSGEGGHFLMRTEGNDIKQWLAVFAKVPRGSSFSKPN
jgi:hypothetical protein